MVDTIDSVHPLSVIDTLAEPVNGDDFWFTEVAL